MEKEIVIDFLKAIFIWAIILIFVFLISTVYNSEKETIRLNKNIACQEIGFEGYTNNLRDDYCFDKNYDAFEVLMKSDGNYNYEVFKIKEAQE